MTVVTSSPSHSSAAPGESEIAAFGRLHQRLGDAVETAVHGKRGVVDLALVSMFAGGHVLLEDVPGTGKTTLARALGKALEAAEGRGEPWQAVAAIRLIALTGCRRSEVAQLKKAETDLKGHALRLEDTKTDASTRPIG